jgi:4-amino-4-deoxy-L-arabinose transferase-like glycosyltransferase
MPDTLAKIKTSFFPERGQRLGLAAYAFLALLCAAFFLPGIAGMPPTDRDESLFAQATKQMVETGNYSDIRVQKEPRYKKPIGIYWMQSAAVRILNPEQLNEIWAYRVPSFIGATVAVIMTAALGALLFTPQAGLLAGVMLAGTVLLNVEARLAKTDAALLACIVTAMFALAQAYLGKASKWKTPVLFWTAVAVGILVKGPVVLLPVFGVMLWLLKTERTLNWFKALRPALGVGYAAALVAPWFIAISLTSHGAFMQQSAGNDLLAKLWQGQNRGILPPGLHLAVFPILFFPNSLFALFAAPDAWRNRADSAVRFCLGWIIPTWLIFELSLTKLPHYVMPTYPAIALLSAKYLLDGFPSVTNAEKRWPITLSVGLWLLVGAALAFVFAALPSFTNKEVFLPQVGVGGVIMLAQGLALAAFFDNKPVSVVIMTIAGFLFLTTTIGYSLPRLQHVWLSREIVAAAEQASGCAKPDIMTLGYREPSLVFLAGTETVLAKSADEAVSSLGTRRCPVAVVAEKHKQAFGEAVGRQGAKATEKLSLTGLNAGRGKKMELTVFTFAGETP